jgi:serine/threonine-protein kinase
VLITALAARLLMHSSKPGKLDADLIAVAPFDVRGASLGTWSEGMVEYLSRSLDGAGELRTVSPSVFLRGWRGRADRATATDLGERTGAGLAVFGSLVQGGGDSVRLRATLLDVATGQSQGQVEVTGDTLGIDRVADSLAVSLLNALGRTRPIAAVRTAPFGGAPLPALKEFLQGERFYRRSLYDSALVHHARAVALDGTFALAYRRMALELGWSPATQGSFEDLNVYALRAGSLNHGLTPRDSLLIAADSNLYATNVPSAPDEYALRRRAFALLEEAARRFPGDPEVWFGLGELRYHVGLNTATEALQTFDRAIALDSGFAPAYEHVLRLATWNGGEEMARRYARPYETLNVTDGNSPSIRFAVLLLDPARSHTPDVARLIDTIDVASLWRAGFEHLAPWVDSAETTIRVLRALPRGRRSLAGAQPWVADTLMWPQYLGGALVYRGHLQEAWAVYQQVLTRPNSKWWASFADPIRDLALMRALSGDTVGAGLFAKTARSKGPFSPRWLSWWFARRDTATLVRIVGQAERGAGRMANAQERARAEYVRSAAPGYLALLRGDSVAAQRRFETLSDSACLQFDCTPERLTLGRLVAGRGDDRGAAEILDRWYRLDVGPVWVLARLERARIAERLGERDAAIRGYQFVLDAWRHADPELQPYVADARAGLARLAREPH